MWYLVAHSDQLNIQTCRKLRATHCCKRTTCRHTPHTHRTSTRALLPPETRASQTHACIRMTMTHTHTCTHTTMPHTGVTRAPHRHVHIHRLAPALRGPPADPALARRAPEGPMNACDMPQANTTAPPAHTQTHKPQSNTLRAHPCC